MGDIINSFFEMLQGTEISNYFNTLLANPLKIVLSIIDLIIVGFIVIKVNSCISNCQLVKLGAFS